MKAQPRPGSCLAVSIRTATGYHWKCHHGALNSMYQKAASPQNSTASAESIYACECRVQQHCTSRYVLFIEPLCWAADMLTPALGQLFMEFCGGAIRQALTVKKP